MEACVTDKTRESWYWDDWWREGQQASCLSGPDGGYSGETEYRWQKTFASLPNGSRILDVCTGNGAIAAIAVKTSDQHSLNLDVSAMDRAIIDPPRFVRGVKALKKVTFYSDRPVEKTRLESGAYDLVTSQYGLEYADIPAALKEVVRLIAPSGQICLAMHAEEGMPVKNSKDEISNGDYLIEDLKLFTALYSALDALSLPLSGNRMPEPVAKLQNVMGRLQRRVQEHQDNPMLENTFGVISHALNNIRSAGTPAVREKIKDVETGVVGHVHRSRALLEAARSQQGCDAMAEHLSDMGMTNARYQSLEHNNPRRQVAWWLTADKPAQ
jgi:ubiquinone/menaquinone biosynthesis C-methylase UbiE